jgi:hypothetical protein
MKQFGSSAREKQPTTKRRDTTKNAIDVRYVKFSPEEMAYEAPEDVSDPNRFPTIARGRPEWLEFLAFKRGYVRLAPELRRFFKDEEAVNDALRKLVQAMPGPVKKRKTA